MTVSLSDIQSQLPEIHPKLFSKPNVTATGIGYKIVEGRQSNDLCIICSVENKIPKNRLSQKELLPTTYQDIPIDVFPTGLIHAQQDPLKKHRPAPGGISVGHYQITAGTLGCWVKKKNKFYILSNNHVLANSNNASIGDAILQPGPTDGGTSSSDRLAILSEFIPIIFEENTSPCPIANMFSFILNTLANLTGSKTRLQPMRLQTTDNLIDAAIAEPVSEKNIKNEIMNIGTIKGISEGTLGTEIKKMGRTTGLTSGTITQIDATVRVNYGTGKIAVFSDQLITGPISQGGDSGSAVLNNQDKLIGLLFAGSSNTTILNQIRNVFSLLELSL